MLPVGRYSTWLYSTASTVGAVLASLNEVSPSSPAVNGVVRFVAPLPILQRSVLPSSERPYGSFGFAGATDTRPSPTGFGMIAAAVRGRPARAPSTNTITSLPEMR